MPKDNNNEVKVTEEKDVVEEISPTVTEVAEIITSNEEESNVIKLAKLKLRKKMLVLANEISVGKNGKNTYSNYDYIRPDDITNSMRPLLLKYDIFYDFTLEDTDDGKNSAILTVYDLEDINGVIKYISKVDSVSVKGASSAQNYEALLTYMKRYSLMNAFFISGADDIDLDNNKSFSEKSPKEETEEKINNLITQARKIANIANGRNPEMAKAIVGKYTADGNIKNLRDVTKLNKLIEELGGVR